MNHDYAHCLDYTKDCPKDCFRAKLQRDIEENRSEFVGVPLTYAHLGDTDECKLAKDKDVTCKMSLETDCVSRQAAIDAVEKESQVDGAYGYMDTKSIVDLLMDLPSVQPEEKPIDYHDCSNAMLRMWMDNVVTDGEYNRIMDKLNAHWGKEG